ncbi:hypothetical protein SAMN05192561_1263 [Halopenitus malekzadehii]|uniref:DUF8110 domain-containing protein n=2 Tax=Halopenitus malekzadehii TaxID=1267564 RepID=A0A1H6JWJ1_9EURY|nr:hypothetical protein SAMN05192561_1263 [Halopenitus malekzadehii]
MLEELEEEYPEAVPYIRTALEDHGEAWVLENYFPQIAQLGVVMKVPSVEELPFFDPAKHDSLSEQEQRERAAAYAAYRENLRTGHKPEKSRVLCQLVLCATSAHSSSNLLSNTELTTLHLPTD